MISFKKRTKENKQTLILDTSGIIDGRILAIAKAGFVPETIVVPQFVIAELQYLADTGDSQKRERARFGLDVIRELQDLRRTRVVVAREQFSKIKEVDDKLIALAKQYGGFLYTTDFNLNKVAQIEGVTVLNVNELAQALRPPRLPGERVEIKITQAGQDKTQGVGFLEDGTMVVVEGAGRLINHKVSVQFSRILQTHAGKMMFAVLTSKPAMAQVDKATIRPVNHVRQRPGIKQQNQPKKQPEARPIAKPRAVWHSGSSPNKHHRHTPEDSLLQAIERQSRDN